MQWYLLICIEQQHFDPIDHTLCVHGQHVDILLLDSELALHQIASYLQHRQDLKQEQSLKEALLIIETKALKARLA